MCCTFACTVTWFECFMCGIILPLVRLGGVMYLYGQVLSPVCWFSPWDKLFFLLMSMHVSVKSNDMYRHKKTLLYYAVLCLSNVHEIFLDNPSAPEYFCQHELATFLFRNNLFNKFEKEYSPTLPRKMDNGIRSTTYSNELLKTLTMNTSHWCIYLNTHTFACIVFWISAQFWMQISRTSYNTLVKVFLKGRKKIYTYIWKTSEFQDAQPHTPFGINISSLPKLTNFNNTQRPHLNQ